MSDTEVLEIYQEISTLPIRKQIVFKIFVALLVGETEYARILQTLFPELREAYNRTIADNVPDCAARCAWEEDFEPYPIPAEWRPIMRACPDAWNFKSNTMNE